MTPIEEIMRYELEQPEWMDSTTELARRLDYPYHKAYRLFRMPRMKRLKMEQFIEIYTRLECEPSRIQIAFLALRFVEDRYNVIEAYRLAMRRLASYGAPLQFELQSDQPGNTGE